MKKLLLIAAAVVFTSASYAQTIIPKAGLTLSNWGGDDVSGTDAKIGFTLGAGFNMPLGEGPISLQPELNFIQKGYKADVSFDGIDIETKTTLSYLEVPVLVKATFGEATKFFVNAGPSVGFGLGGKVKAEANGEEEEVDVKFGDGDDEDVFYVEKKTDIAFQLGGGVVIADKIQIDIRYGLGLTDLYEDAKVKNNVFQFTVGVPLSISK
jgi:hypothetical protein